MRLGGVPARRIALGLAAALLLGPLCACAKDGDEPARPPEETRPASVTFTQIWVGYRAPGSPDFVTRNKASAEELARKLIARIRAGESMEKLVVTYSDDHDPRQRPFNEGSYSKTYEQIRHAELRRVVFSLKVGELAPEPVDSGVAFHVLRRDL